MAEVAPLSADRPRADDTATRSSLPDARGHFGAFGGRFVSETLMAALRRARSNLARQLSASPEDDKAGQ